MAVLTTDIVYRLSGGASNADGDAALGGTMSSELASETVNELFDVISGAENAASDVEYRCIYVLNTNGTDTLYGAAIYIASQVANGAALAIGLDPAGVSATGTTIANESAAPAGVSFSSADGSGNALSIGDLAASAYQAVWLRRTAADSAALDDDGATLTVTGDTAE